MFSEYLIKEAVSLVTDNQEVLPVKANQLHFTYQPKVDKDMALDGWSISKMFQKENGHYVMVYKRTTNNDNYMVEI